MPWEELENEIRQRLKDPSEFEDGSFRRIILKQDKPQVHAIIGRLKGQDTTTLQALRFPKGDGWTVASAKSWLAEHPDVKEGQEMNATETIEAGEHTPEFLEKMLEFFRTIASKEQYVEWMKKARAYAGGKISRPHPKEDMDAEMDAEHDDEMHPD